MEDSVFISLCQSQYKAAFKMLENLIEECPDELWNKESKVPPFWQQIYHILYYLDFYSEDTKETFKQTFSIEENLDERFDEILSKEELLKYTNKLKNKINTKLELLTTKKLESKSAFFWTGANVAEKIIYSLRHAQHHIGQLNYLLKIETNSATKWILTGSDKPRKG